MTDEQKDTFLVFPEFKTGELSGLQDICGIKAVANTQVLLDCLPTLFLLIFYKTINVKFLILFFSRTKKKYRHFKFCANIIKIQEDFDNLLVN